MADTEAPQAPEYIGDPQSLLRDVLERYQDGKKVRASKETDWYIAREFYRGNQYVASIGGRYVTLPNPKNKPRIVVNRSRTNIDTVLAYMLRQEPVFVGKPKTGEPEDQAAAYVANQILYHYWDLLKCEAKRLRCGQYAFLMGRGIWKIVWDPMAGPKIPRMQRQERLIDVSDPAVAEQMAAWIVPEPEYDLVPTGEEDPAGDVRIDVVSPFEFIPDPGAETLDDAQWCIHHTMLPVDPLRAQYPQAADSIQAEEPDWESGYEKQTLASFGAGSAQLLDRRRRARALVLELYRRPCREYEQGLRVVCTRHTILESGPTPPGWDALPFADWSDRDVPGEFWSDGRMRGMIPLQKDLNKATSQLVIIAEKFKNKYAVVSGSVDVNQIDDTDCEVIEHQPGQRPELLAPPQIPQALLARIEKIENAMDEASDAIAVLRGQATGEVRSGRQVAYQGQYGETKLALPAKAQARFLARAGKLILELVQENVTEQRIARVMGKNRKMDVKSFIGADIKGNTDVIVEDGTLLGYTKTERFNVMKDMLQMQVITPEKFLDNMEMADFYPMIEEQAQDRNNAMRENEEWRQGQIGRPPKPYEDHRMHLRYHNYFRKQQQFDAMDLSVQQQIDQHCAVHEQFVADMVGAQGGPGAGPDAGPEPGNADMAPTVPTTPGEQQGMIDQAMQQSGQELAEGLPPVPPVPDIGPENQH